MPREKPLHKGGMVKIDRMPERTRLLLRIAKALENPGEFYRFERVVFPVAEHPRVYSAFAKAGLFDERAPVLARLWSGEEVLLRISGLLSILRGYEENKMNDFPHPLKFYTEEQVFFAPAHRKEDVVEHREWAIIMIGDEGPVAEAEIIQIFWKAFEKLGLGERVGLRINAVGCAVCQNGFRSSLASYLRSRVLRLCKNCRRKAKSSNVKVLRCSDDECRRILETAPQVLDFLCEICKKHLRGILEFLGESGIPYSLDHSLFLEGLWYDTIVFEFAYTASSAESGAPASDILVEGGRMMRAGEAAYGKRLDVVGGSVFMDRVEQILVDKGKLGAGAKKIDVFFAHLSDAAKKKSLPLLEELRQGGVSVEESLGKDSVRSQLKIAERVGAKIALILGQKEALDSTIIVREMESGIQETISQEKLIEFLKRKLKR